MQAQAKEVRRQSVVEHSLVTSPQCMFTAKIIKTRSFKSAELLPSWETTGSGVLLCSRGSGANQETQGESFSKNKIKEKCVHRASIEFHTEI